MGGSGLRVSRRGLALLLLAILGPACLSGTPTFPPDAPTNLAVSGTPTTARIDLIWTDVATNEGGYTLERSEDGGFTWVQINLLKDSQSYSDLGLNPGQTYTYQLSSWNSAGYSAVVGPLNVPTANFAWTSYTGGPGLRADHSSIYDSTGQRMVMFGGQDGSNFLNDVWTLNLDKLTANNNSSDWTPKTPTGIPPSIRAGHSAVFDSKSNRMIVFGGLDGNDASFKNDVHVLDLSGGMSWTSITISGGVPAPVGRMGHTAIYDPINEMVVVFGGTDGTTELGDVGFLRVPMNSPSFSWVSFSPGTGPVKRTKHSAVYDAVGKRMIIFGGLDNLTVPDGSLLNQDTWSLSLGAGIQWSSVPTPGSPSFRKGHTAVCDTLNQRMLVFGGDLTGIGIPLSSEFWSLKLNTPVWGLQTPSSAPGARNAHTAIYDSQNGRIVIYGGIDELGGNLDDVWVTDL